MSFWITSAIFMFLMGLLVMPAFIIQENNEKYSEQARKNQERSKRMRISKEQWAAGKKARIRNKIIGAVVCCLIGVGFLCIENDVFTSSSTTSKCWICNKPATQSFGNHRYCDKHYSEAIANTMIMSDNNK